MPSTDVDKRLFMRNVHPELFVQIEIIHILVCGKFTDRNFVSGHGFAFGFGNLFDVLAALNPAR